MVVVKREPERKLAGPNVPPHVRAAVSRKRGGAA
jgi:hypothetical protein